VRWNTRRQAAAEHQPRRVRHAGFDGFLNRFQLGFIDGRSEFVELDGQALFVRDCQVRAAFTADIHGVAWEPFVLEHRLNSTSRLAAGRQNRRGFSAEGVNHAGSIDAAPACGFRSGEDVTAIFEHQVIDEHGPVHCGIYGQSENQTLLL
jgi:hypothetical protein